MLQFKRIFVGSRCQNECRPCAAAGREAEVAPGAIDAAIREASAENVLFWGGEPLLRADLPDLARLAAGRGAKRLKVRTNARALNDHLLGQLLDAGVYFYQVKVCGPEAEAHDEVCGSRGAWAETTAGLAAIRAVTEVGGRELKPYLEIIVPVVGANLDLLAATVYSVLTFDPDRIHFELADPELSLLKAVPYLRDALENAMFNKVWATTLGVPLCLMAGWEPHLREALSGAPSGRKLKPCKKCVLREVCPGVAEAVVGRQGERQIEAQLSPCESHRHLESLRLLRQPLQAAPKAVTP